MGKKRYFVPGSNLAIGSLRILEKSLEPRLRDKWLPKLY